MSERPIRALAFSTPASDQPTAVPGVHHGRDRDAGPRHRREPRDLRARRRRVDSAVAVILALVGVFAVLAQSVAHRAREIAVRVALGAAPRDIRRLVLGWATVIAASGVVIGLAGAWFASRLLTTFLYEVEPTDPAVLSVIALLLFVVTLVASVIPARRATHIDPLETIRSE